MDATKKHSFATVLSSFELKGYLTPFRVDAELPPLPTAPVQSYDRRDSWSSSKDSFYTLDEELASERDDRSETPRPGTKVSLHTTHPSNGAIGLNAIESIQEHEEISSPDITRTRTPISAASSTDHFNLYQDPEEGTRQSTEDGITEQELRELEDDLTPRPPKVKSKDLGALFGEDLEDKAASTTPKPQLQQRRVPDFADIVMGGDDDRLADRLFGGGELSDQSYTKRETYVEDVRRKIGWKATSSNTHQLEADRRDFADLIMGEDDRGLSDKLFGRKGPPTLAKKSFEVHKSTRPHQSESSGRDFMDMVFSGDGNGLAEKLFGGDELPGQSFDRSAKRSTAPPTQRTAWKRSTALDPGQPLPPRSQQHQQHSSISGSSQSTTTASQPETAASTVSRLSDESNTDWYSKFATATTAGAPLHPLSSHPQTTETLRPPQQQPRVSTDSSVSSVSALSEATSTTTADSTADSMADSTADSDAEFAYLRASTDGSVAEVAESIADSDAGCSTAVMGHKPSISLVSEISAADLSAPPILAASAPDVQRSRSFRSFHLPMRRGSLVSIVSLDSVAPPPISLLRSERKRPGSKGSDGSSKSSGGPLGSLKHALLRKQTQKRQGEDFLRLKQQSSLDEQELLAYSVRYERAASLQTPFTNKDVASVFPSRRGGETGAAFGPKKSKKRGNVPIGLDVLREHQVAEAARLPSLGLGRSANNEVEAADRYRAERAEEMASEQEVFTTPLGSAKRLSVLVEE